VFTNYLAHNFGLAIIALTIIVNLCMFPLTLSQIRSSKAMQDMQPKIEELKKKYGKDRQKLSQEQMKLYKESGIKPAGCLLTMIIQMPVWIALYQSILLTLAVAPEGLLNLSRYLYNWPLVYSIIPLNRMFLFMDLANPNFVLAIIVGATMWMQQKMSMAVSSTDPRQAQQQQLMIWMMPMMFALITLSVPSGLGLYWAANSIVRIVMQYRISGWGGLRRQRPKETAAEKKYVKFDESVQKSVDDVGADIVISDSKGETRIDKPSKSRYLPGKDRAQRRRKK
jgi:YidC/Oxa1 family membrane protein insertase